MKLAFFAVAAVAAALLLLRRRLALRYLALSALLWMAWIAVWLVAPDRYLAVVACGVLDAVLLWVIVARAQPYDVRWSATRAATAALLFYMAAVPLMMRTPPDGDEPFYILITESVVRDHDFDLRNQFLDLAHSATRRTDLVPQVGDELSPGGPVYSHLEPFLALLLIPGYATGGLAGVLATMAVFGALLARSTVRMFEEEGIDDRTIRAVFPFVALGPPIVFYAVRVWPEVPAAWLFVEAIRGIRARRPKRWITALFGLVLLKLRFLLIAVVLVARAVRRPRQMAVAAALMIVPLAVGWFLFGRPTLAHSWTELVPGKPAAMIRGFFGLLVDGEAGLLFQAPIYLLGIVALTRWRSMPAAFRLGMSASALYVFYLVPRAEWHGGWSPPLRYIVVFMPILGLGCAALWHRVHGSAIAVAAAWTIGLVMHGMAFPWRLFHIANGECVAGEALSSFFHSDFSRLFPSYIRMNTAAFAGGAVVVIALLIFRNGRLVMPLALAALALALVFGRRPGSRIEFEDEHVTHRGGELYPYVWQVERFLYRGGWIVRAGDSLSFLAKRGPSVLWYQGNDESTIQMGGRAYVLPPTGTAYAAVPVEIDRGGRVELRVLHGAVNLDRMDHE